MIYLDYNASTPVDPAVREAMLPHLGDFYGNPSSSHAMGRPLREAVIDAWGVYQGRVALTTLSEDGLNRRTSCVELT